MINRQPLIIGNKSLEDITNDICEPVETIPGGGWLGMFLSAKALFIFYIISVGIVIATGMGLMVLVMPEH
jgi:hypothetical protein